MKKIKIFTKHGKCNRCIIFLPGRQGSALQLMQLYDQHLKDITLIGIEPETEWYPLPKGAEDQSLAVVGMKKTRKALLKKIKTLGYNKIALVGFSAGAVTAIQCAIHSNERFAGIVSHSGAILQPQKTPPVRFPDMPFLLFHNLYDNCFSWHERYLPMKEVLQERGYSIKTIEKTDSTIHGITPEEIGIASKFLVSCIK